MLLDVLLAMWSLIESLSCCGGLTTWRASLAMGRLMEKYRVCGRAALHDERREFRNTEGIILEAIVGELECNGNSMLSDDACSMVLFLVWNSGELGAGRRSSANQIARIFNSPEKPEVVTFFPKVRS